MKKAIPVNKYLFFMPDKNTITNPEKAIRTEVPRSGCNRIIEVGKRTMSKAMTIEIFVGGKVPVAM